MTKMATSIAIFDKTSFNQLLKNYMKAILNIGFLKPNSPKNRDEQDTSEDVEDDYGEESYP